ncbi:alginate export family protein [Colwelliaceae bacterium 6471]
MKSSLKLATLTTAVALALSTPAQAGTLDDVATAVKDSSVKVNLRYRLETVDQDAKAKEATASTLRSRLTWTSAPINNLTFNVEVDNVTAIAVDDYNSTNNGKSEYPVVADPEGTDLNQANFQYKGEQLTFIGGRQRITHNGQRFVGGVAWRQNEQTYDAARFIYKASDAFSFDYSYVFNVNRIFGPTDGAQPADWHGNFHLVNATYKANKAHQFNAFAYLLDNEVNAGASSNTYGIDYKGTFGGVTADLSYATQSDGYDSTKDFSADYYKAELSGKVGTVKLSAGLEVLGSDNGVGFSTPLATLHKFQGFADTFLNTPANGIEDFYVSAVTKINGVKLVATYHDFSADVGNADYGSEIDLVAVYKFHNNVTGLLKFASYDAQDLGTDTTKLWAMATFAF